MATSPNSNLYNFRCNDTSPRVLYPHNNFPALYEYWTVTRVTLTRVYMKPSHYDTYPHCYNTSPHCTVTENALTHLLGLGLTCLELLMERLARQSSLSGLSFGLSFFLGPLLAWL